MFNQKDYLRRYKQEKIARVILDVPRATKTRWKEAAEAAGLPLATFVRIATEEKIATRNN